jgi:hypothetical protein
MNKLLVATLLGAVSIMMLAGLSQGGKPSITRVSALPLPAISPDAPRADTPRECNNAANVTTACSYQ